MEIDINGKSGPNTQGRDQFSLMFNEKGKLQSYGYGNYYEKIVSDGWKMNY